MKKIIIVILSLLSLNTYSYYEWGPTRLVPGPTMSIMSTGNTRMSLGIATPDFVWRDLGETVTFRMDAVDFVEISTNYSDSSLFTYKGTSSIPADRPFTVLASEGMTVNLYNVGGPRGGIISHDEGRDNFGFRFDLGSGNETKRFYAQGTVDVTIPKEVADGIYSLTTRFNNNAIYIGDYSFEGGGSSLGSAGNSGIFTAEVRANFELITYLNAATSGNIDFGKVVFVAGAKAETKTGSINITGGKGNNVKVKVVEPKVLLKQTGKGTETVPAFVKLVDGEYKAGDELEGRLDDTGRKDMTFEVRIEPGLYPDIPEGKYTGLARFEIKYS